MNKIDRQIIELLRKKLKIKTVDNPCDIKGLAIFYNNIKPKIDEVRDYFDELRCYDIPKERLLGIIEELKESDKSMKEKKIFCSDCGKEIKGRFKLNILDTNPNTNKSCFFKSKCNISSFLKKNSKEEKDGK